MADHNLDQCLEELDKEIDAAEKKQIATIRKGAMTTLRSMVFELSPVKTGFYRASHDLMVNGVSKYRRRVSRKWKGVPLKRRIRETQRMMPEAQEQLAKAAKRLEAVKRLAELKQITIANNAPHVHFIEGGGSKKAPMGVFDVARQKANMTFAKLSVESK